MIKKAGLTLFLLVCLFPVSCSANENQVIEGKVVFWSDRTDNKGPAICLWQSGHVRKTPETGINPRWSPEKKRIAIAGGGGREFYGLTILDENGHVIKRYPVGSNPPPHVVAWVPKGNSIMYSSNKSDWRNENLKARVPPNIYQLSLKDGTIKQLTFFDDGKVIPGLDVSPDGRKLIFVRQFSSMDPTKFKKECLISNIDGSNIKKLDILPNNPRWDRTGTRIVYSTGFFKGERIGHGVLAMYDFTTGEETIILDRRGTHPVFSKDGKQVLFSGGWSGLYLLDLDTQEVKTVLPPKNQGFRSWSTDTHPDWYQE